MQAQHKGGATHFNDGQAAQSHLHNGSSIAIHCNTNEAFCSVSRCLQAHPAKVILNHQL